MKSRFLASLLLGGALFLSSSAFAADTWSVDSSHSTAIFRIKHFGASWQYGRFNDIAGTLMIDEADATKSTLELTIKTDSVDTNNQKRDDHLKGPDFFNAAQYPTMTFKSKKIAVKQGNVWAVTGDLTMHGVTKNVTFPATVSMADGVVKAVTEFTINRHDFGISYPGKADDLIQDNVVMRVELVASGA